MILEICANGFESALIAENAGADRIELCTDLSLGGVTPSKQLISTVISKLNIPTHVLIRPRSGDFCYSEVEFEHMLADIAFCKEIGCAGVVSGVLKGDKGVDFERTKQLVDASEGMEFTFHRAFDVCKDPISSMKVLMGLGINRLLSSGQKPNALNGIKLLKVLKELAGTSLEIMPGGGINSDNISAFKESGFTSIHSSATQKMASENDIHDLFNVSVVGHSSKEEIEKMVRLSS